MNAVTPVRTNNSEDVDSSSFDSQDAFSQFCVAWRRHKMGGPWSSVDAAYGLLRATLTPDEITQLWAATKAAGRAADTTSPLLPLYEFGQERDRRYRASDVFKKRRADLETRRSKDPKRIEQVKAAKERYRAKIKAAKAAAFEIEKREVA